MRVLAFLILLYPFIEIAALITLANYIGGGGVMVYLGLSVLLGILMLRHQKLTTLLVLRDWVQRKGRLPAYSLLWPIRYAFAGVLFIIPGVINELVALLILLPIGGIPTPNNKNPLSSTSDDVIEGEYHRVDKPTGESKDRLR